MESLKDRFRTNTMNKCMCLTTGSEQKPAGKINFIVACTNV